MPVVTIHIMPIDADYQEPGESEPGAQISGVMGVLRGGTPTNDVF